MANALTICRIVLSLALLVPPALSPSFLALYAIAGITDMVDGFVARKTNTASELGSRLDSIADLALAIACLAKILPAITVPTWLLVWVALVTMARLVNVISGFVIEKRLVMLHTTANKAAGFVVYLVPFALPLVGVAIPAIFTCAIATFAAVQEGHFIRTGKSEQARA